MSPPHTIISFNAGAVFSTLIGRGISRLGSDWSRDVAPPALLCHKEPARRIQSPLLGALERKIPPLGGFHARKGPILGALML